MVLRIVCLLTLVTASVRAQPLQSLYYDNGTKAAEGRWHFYSTAAFSDNYAGSLAARRSGQAGPHVLALPNPISQYDRVDQLLLSMRCEGLVTTWYPEGAKKSEVNFLHGIPAGPYRRWYPTGTLAMQGTLTDGMPEGLWEVYYNNGQLYMKGAFRPFSQAELSERWRSLFFNADKDFHFHYYRTYDPVEDALDTAGNALATQTESLRHSFNRFSPDVIAKKHGSFEYFYANGAKQAIVHFSNNARDGEWMQWDSIPQPALPRLSLFYSKGRLEAIGTPTGRIKPEDLETWRTKEQKKHKLPPVVVEIAPPQIDMVAVSRYAEFRGSLNDYLRNALPEFSSKEFKHLSSDTVVAKFYVAATGGITDVRIEGNGNKSLEKALRKAFTEMPAWRPAELDGKLVGQQMKVKIHTGLIIETTRER